MTESNSENPLVFGPFENNTIGNVEEHLFTDWNTIDDNFDDANDDDTILWNLDGLENDNEGEADATGWNFEDRNTNDSNLWTSGNIDAIDGSSSNDDTNEFDEEPLRRQMRQGANDLEHSEELEAVEDQSSDNDSQNGILADDNMKPSTSRMASNEGGAQFSNDNFEIKIKKIGFKKYTKFNFCDILYNVHLNSKPGQSTVLLKDAIEGLLQSIANILEDLKSQIDGSNDRILHLVSQCASKTLKFK